jgi:hypothetical protein
VKTSGLFESKHKCNQTNNKDIMADVYRVRKSKGIIGG